MPRFFSMIISASRRTDIPALFAREFQHALQEGEITIPNPLFPSKSYTVSLKAKDVDGFVFWTRYATPFLPVLNNIDSLGIPYYFLFTITGYGKPLELNNPGLQKQIESFIRLSEKISSDRIIWRYDPIILSNHTPYSYHLEKFEIIASQLKSYTNTVIISIVDQYRKTRKAFFNLEKEGWYFDSIHSADIHFIKFLKSMKRLSEQYNLHIQSCADKSIPPELIAPGACIRVDLFNKIFGTSVSYRKDPAQRQKCLCHISRDIGTYGTCALGCIYCYAGTSRTSIK